MRIWPWSTIKDLRFHVKALEAEREQLKQHLVEAQMQSNSHRNALDKKTEEHKGHMRQIAATLVMRGLDKFVLMVVLLFSLSASAQPMLRNLWTTNNYSAQNPVIAVTSEIISNANSSITIQPNGTNTTFTGVQTNAYGNNWTNQYQIQTIDMRNTRTTFGLFANEYALTNNFQNPVGDDSTYIGFSAGFSELGTYQAFNTAIGAFTLSTATNGSGSIAIGQKAITDATNCDSSIGIGGKTLSRCLNPARDVAIGYASMQFSTGGDISGPNTGGDRTAIGYNSGEYDGGQQNVFIGSQSGPTQGVVVSPQDSVGIGYAALTQLTSGFGNVCIGANAGGGITGNSSETGIGYQALQAGSSYGATAIGFNAGQGASGCNGSIFLGGNAGISCTTRSTFIAGGNDDNEFITNVVFGSDQASTKAAARGVLVLQTSGGSGLNNPGEGFQIAAGPGTGNTAGGNLYFGVAFAGTSGSTQNGYTNVVDISSANGVLSARVGFASYATNITSISTGGWTNVGPKTLRVFGFTGTSVIFSNSVSKLNFSLGTITTGSTFTLNPSESLTGTSCACAGSVLLDL